MTTESPRRLPGLDAWRGLGVLFLYDLLFFGRNIESLSPWDVQPGLVPRIAAGVARVLYFSGVLGVDLLFMVSGFLAFEALQSGRKKPLAYVLGRYARLLPLLAVISIPYVAYGGITPGDYLKGLLLLTPANAPQAIDQAFAGADAFLVFSLFIAGWKLAGRFWPPCAGWTGLAGATALTLLLIVYGPGRLPVNGHFLSFLWGVGIAKLTAGPTRIRKAPGWWGAVMILAAVLLCYKFSADRGISLYYLLSERDWHTLSRIILLQGVLAGGLALSLNPVGFWDAFSPVRLIGRASYCFFMACVLWSFVLTGAYRHLFENPLASLAFLYSLTLGMTLALALVFKPFFEPSPRTPGKSNA